MTIEVKAVHTVAEQETHEFCKVKGFFDLNDTHKVTQQFDNHGNHRLVYQELTSEWKSYRGIAKLEVPEVGQFVGTSDYYRSELPCIFQLIDSFTNSIKGKGEENGTL